MPRSTSPELLSMLTEIETLQSKGGLMSRAEKQRVDEMLILACRLPEVEMPPEGELLLDSRAAMYWHDRAKTAETLLVRSRQHGRNWAIACGTAVSLLLCAVALRGLL